MDVRYQGSGKEGEVPGNEVGDEGRSSEERLGLGGWRENVLSFATLI